MEAVHFNPQSTTQRNEEISYREKLIMIHKLYSFFENFIQFPQLQLPDNLNKNLSMEELAEKCREYYELGEEPIINMVSFMEAVGIVITGMNMDRRGASPYSQKQSINGKEKYKDCEKFLINRFFHDYLIKYFENVVIPKKWRFVEKIPVDVQGKKHKLEIMAMFEEGTK